jgi:DNA-binding response OmpR family regulator
VKNSGVSKSAKVVLEDILKMHGARIIGPYGNLDAAYRRAERDHFDVGIIDINLRDEEAYPVADELMRQRIPFCFCTGYDARVVPERFAGARVFQKPYDPSEIVKHIRQLWQHAGGGDQADD